MDANGVLLVGGGEGDGRDDGTGFHVWLRPNVDSAGAETIMTKFKGSSGGGGLTVPKRFVEVRRCRRHSECAGRRGKGCWKKESKETFWGERILFLYWLDPELL